MRVEAKKQSPGIIFSPSVYTRDFKSEAGIKWKPTVLDDYTEDDAILLFETKVEYSPGKAPCNDRQPRRSYRYCKPSPSVSQSSLSQYCDSPTPSFEWDVVFESEDANEESDESI